MNPLTAVRLGKVDAGIVEQGKAGERGKENVATPIVLWSKDPSGTVPLYLSLDTREAAGTFKQNIDYLERSDMGLKERLKHLPGAYPISFSGSGMFTMEDYESRDYMLDCYTKDINGDGIDELIIIRKLGGVEVYDREKQLFRYKPKSDPKLYKYKIKARFISLFDHDEIFFAIEQSPHDAKNATTRDTWIVRVNSKGISEIHPVFPDHNEPESIDDIAVMSRPGSKTVDEMAVISTIKGRGGYHLSRHKSDGTAIDAPREIYTEYDIYCSAFGFAGSNQIIINNEQHKMLYFVTPDKPVNWIKAIDLKKLIGGDADINIIGKTTINSLALLVLEYHGKLYALDALGKFHTSMNPANHTSTEPVAFMTFKPDSNKHSIVKIVPTDKTMESYLVIQSRDPGRRDLTLEELEKAGKKFLTDDDWNDCKEELRLKYRETTHELAESYCEEHKIPMPEIHSWEDIEKKLPGYYIEVMEYAQRSYHRSLELMLFKPIEDYKEGYVLEDNDYKNIAEYKIWLSSVYVAPELVFSIHHVSKGVSGHQRLSEYYFHEPENLSGFSQPSINIRASGEHGQAFMALYKKVINKKDVKPAYYAIAW